MAGGWVIKAKGPPGKKPKGTGGGRGPGKGGSGPLGEKKKTMFTPPKTAVEGGGGAFGPPRGTKGGKGGGGKRGPKSLVFSKRKRGASGNPHPPPKVNNGGASAKQQTGHLGVSLFLCGGKFFLPLFTFGGGTGGSENSKTYGRRGSRISKGFNQAKGGGRGGPGKRFIFIW